MNMDINDKCCPCCGLGWDQDWLCTEDTEDGGTLWECPECRAQVADQFEQVDGDGYDDYDDSMDGDHASALASCGWGTDEDYGYYGDD